MSSPLTPGNKGVLRRGMVNAHQALSHGSRVRQLAAGLAEGIQSRCAGVPEIRCLDVGCGDMTLAEEIRRLCPRTTWRCIDLYELPEALAAEERWRKYRSFDGRRIPFEDGSFDVVLFCDVLHHSGDAAADLLREAGRVGRWVAVKDHFESSLYSRLMLWLMDLVGNWGYGVPLPKRYFSTASFKRLVAECGLVAAEMERGIELYAHLPVLRKLQSPLWQFVAFLEKKPRP